MKPDTGVMCLPAKECLKATDSWKIIEEGSSPGAFRGSVALLTHCFLTLASRRTVRE